MKKTLEKRIIFFAFTLLFLTILANSGMDIVGFRRDYVNALVLRSYSLGTSMKNSVEKVLALGLELTDIAGLSQRCLELVQGNPDIAYCVIADLDGAPLFLNDPAFQSLKFGPINRSISSKPGQQINVIGKDKLFYDTVIPIMSPDGKMVANVHVGFEEKMVAGKVEAMIVRSIFVLIISFIIAFSLVVLFVKRSIMQPISSLLKGLNKISKGAFDTRIQEVPVYEFNELAKNINFMSESLKSREEEIQKNYLDLEKTNVELHSSYLRLERLSVELERSEELYKSLMEDASDAIVVIGNDETVKMVNKMAEDFFGYSSREIGGLPLTKLLLLLNINDIPRIHNLFKDAARGMHIDEEIRFVKKEGTLVVGRLHASSIKSDGEHLVQAIFRDVTKEREIVKNLEKSAEDLLRLNKMKDSFLGLASHELKTPLTVIMGYSELILSDMVGMVDKTLLEMVENIANAAGRLDSIIKDMVDVSMIDEKRLQLKIEEVNLNRLIEISVNELRFFFSLRKQEIDLRLDETIPIIKGDSYRLIQLLSNVLNNAIKFTPDGGTITVTTSAKYLLRSKKPDESDHMPPVVNIGKEHHLYVEVTVEDTGIGIDREEQVRIFEKFYEVGNIEEHSTGKVAFRGKGTGLGLAIAKGIVEIHGGDIWVESQGYNPDSCPGSVFHILLPLNPVIGDGTIDYLNLL
jgi:PAS domain S-box-containing protein